jgi:SnoaL-like domain
MTTWSTTAPPASSSSGSGINTPARNSDHAHLEVTGPRAVQLAVEQTRAAQPDLRFHIDAILGDGDLVAVAGTASRGSHPSPAAPGLIWLIRLKDGLMAEMWTYRNTASY